MFQKIRDVVIGSRLAGTVISRKMVIAIGTGVIKANEPKILKEFGESLELTEGWAQNVLRSQETLKSSRLKNVSFSFAYCRDSFGYTYTKF